MVKIWLEGFWKPQPQGEAITVDAPGVNASFTVVLILAALLVAMGVYPEPLIQYANEATLLLWTEGAR